MYEVKRDKQKQIIIEPTIKMQYKTVLNLRKMTKNKNLKQNRAVPTVFLMFCDLQNTQAEIETQNIYIRL